MICPAFTFYATVEPIVHLGATPVFCDIDPATLNLDPADVVARVTRKTKAIVAVHLFGRPAPIDALPEGIPVLEDAAQAFGARIGDRRVGSMGAAATFSFFPTKNLFAFGDGGLVTTEDPAIAETVRLLRFHGSRDKQTFDLVGYNSRLDELQAAVLRVFLGELDGWNASRREAAARYEELGLGELVEIPEDDPGAVYHMYVVRSPERDRILAVAPRGRDRRGRLLHPSPSSPAVPGRARLRAGVAARDGARRRREPRAAALGRHHGFAAGGGRERRSRRARRPSCRRPRLT